MFIYMCVCVCVYVCIYTHVHVYIHIYIKDRFASKLITMEEMVLMQLRRVVATQKA